MKYAAACVHIKDEGDILLEWMAFHRAVGFDHLIIIDNGSSDRSAEIIKKFSDQSSVSYLFQPIGDPNSFAITILKTFGNEFEWMAFIDADEFLYPVNGGDIKNVLARFSDAAGIGVFWQLYGSSGHINKPNGLIIENMTHRAEDKYHSNHHIKSIVRPRDVWHPLGSHVFKLNGLFMDEKRRILHQDPPYGFYPELEPSHNIIRINHYHVLSKNQYLKKILRGYFGKEDTKVDHMNNNFESMWGYHDKNDIFDDSACAYVPLMKFYIENTIL